MASYCNEKIELKATPGTCSIKINGEFSSDVYIDGSRALKKTVNFDSKNGAFPGLTNCSGKGKIFGMGLSFIIDGKSSVLSSDTGFCVGKGTAPNGAIIPCSCKIDIKGNVQKNVTTGAMVSGVNNENDSSDNSESSEDNQNNNTHPKTPQEGALKKDNTSEKKDSKGNVQKNVTTGAMVSGVNNENDSSDNSESSEDNQNNNTSEKKDSKSSQNTQSSSNQDSNSNKKNGKSEIDTTDSLKEILTDDYWYKKLAKTIKSNSNWESFIGPNIEEGKIFPIRECTFNAINKMRPKNIKVVIFGQDPYPRIESANGVAFWDSSLYSWQKTTKSTSLMNIFKSLLLSKNLISKDDSIEFARKIALENSILEPLKFFMNSMEQGVLWLNRALTFESKEQESLDKHLLFWEPTIKQILKTILAYGDSTVFVFWGEKAKELKPFIESNQINKVEFVENCHPALHEFLNKNSFIEIEKAQKKLNQKPINWLFEEKD